jgi:hypothetical protein
MVQQWAGADSIPISGVAIAEDPAGFQDNKGYPVAGPDCAG